MDDALAAPSADDISAYAEENLITARRAFDGLARAAARSSGAMEESRAVVGEGLLALQREAAAAADANVAAFLDHAMKLAAARGPAEVLELQHRFAVERLSAFGDQSLALARHSVEFASRLGLHVRARL